MTIANTAPRLRDLFAMPGFLRLWAVGGCSNAMRWLEVLASALFTLEVTGSGLMVAIVSAARTLPMFCFGALAGVISDAVNRKHILVTGMFITATCSVSVALLGLLGLAQPWHVATAALVSGTVWATDMATRRRMVGEIAQSPGAGPAASGGGLVARSLALDTVTNSVARMIGPIVGGLAYQSLGLAGAFAISACFYLVSALLALGLRYSQATRKLSLARVPADLGEGFSYARGQPIILGVLGITIAMNMFGFSYTALLAPLGRNVFHVAPVWVGVLAAGEPFGALTGGLFLARGNPPVSGRVLMVGGTLIFLVSMMLLPLSPWFALACAIMLAGGFGSAAFANMQTALIVLHAPGHIRSRLMGLLTVCIGTAPLGLLLIGALADRFGPTAALEIMGACGLAVVSAVNLWWRQRGAETPAE
jgi:MFS family permease